MKTKLLLLAVVLSAFAFTTNTTKNEEADKKIVICHIPPGNPANMHAIEISVNALQAHLDHGDSVGDCNIN